MVRYYIKNTKDNITIVQIVEAANSAIVQDYITNKTSDNDFVSKGLQADVANFVNANSKNISFNEPFETPPDIKITLDANSVAVPYKTNASVNGFTVRFQVPYSGNINWEASA